MRVQFSFLTEKMTDKQIYSDLRLAYATQHDSGADFKEYPFVHIMNNRNWYYLPLSTAELPAGFMSRRSSDVPQQRYYAQGLIKTLTFVFALRIRRSEFAKHENRQCEAVIMKKNTPLDNMEKEFENYAQAKSRPNYKQAFAIFNEKTHREELHTITLKVVNFYDTSRDLIAVTDADVRKNIFYNRISQVGAFVDFYKEKLRDNLKMLHTLQINSILCASQILRLSESTALKGVGRRITSQTLDVINAFLKKNKREIGTYYAFAYDEGTAPFAQLDFISKSNTSSFYRAPNTNEIEVYLFDFDTERALLVSETDAEGEDDVVVTKSMLKRKRLNIDVCKIK